MSTFGGCMPEFPDIRVDFFRKVDGLRPPLACFLSHVHSDHLAGLESLKSPFVYCSAATKEMLIRLERFPHRINFQKKILESRRQHYRDLEKRLKPIPLETPTKIELAPDYEIQVTLFDANHCTGAVMFLFEGDGKSVLYTGDIRSEPWFVNNLTRSPSIVEYTTGLKKLDCIYLDTSFTDRIHFPTKADGLKELLEKVARYPPETIFHFEAWTFGYEGVWLALSRALQSSVHVDSYKMRIYQSLRKIPKRDDDIEVHLANEAPVLAGFKCGNQDYAGILTLDQNSRLHSCEKATDCKCYVDSNTVWIRPIITRVDGREIGEIGVGGGKGDLNQHLELELDNNAAIQQLLASLPETTTSIQAEVEQILTIALGTAGKSLLLDDFSLDIEGNDMPLDDLARILAESVARKQQDNDNVGDLNGLPTVITFPYSRHSSFYELRHLVRVFRPLDVYPCTVDKVNWHVGVSIKSMFGDLCSGQSFRHDLEMQTVNPKGSDLPRQDTQSTVHSQYSRTDLSLSNEESANKIFLHNSDNLPYYETQNDSEAIVHPFKQTTSSFSSLRQRDRKLLSLYDLDEKPLKYDDKTSFDPPEDSAAMRSGSYARSLRRKTSPNYHDLTENKRSKIQSCDAGANHSSEQVRFSTSKFEGASKTITLFTKYNTHCCITPSKGVGALSEMAMVYASPAVQAYDCAGEWIGVSTNTGIKPIPVVSYFDPSDNVYRCISCGWEVWRSVGICRGCGHGDAQYYEVLDPEKEKVNRQADDIAPGIVADKYCDEDEVRSEFRPKLTGDCLDCVSAYSSSEYDLDDYEMDSFIDDASTHNTEGSTNETTRACYSDDDEADWKARYVQLSMAYDRLQQFHIELNNEHEQLLKDFLGSDHDVSFDPEGNDSDAVEVDVHDTPISELIPSYLQRDSQGSEISAIRITVRESAFHAALDFDGNGWHGVSLMSTGDNHTTAEPEL